MQATLFKGEKMAKKDVIKRVEDVIKKVSNDILTKKAGSGADKLEALAKLINALRKLYEVTNPGKARERKLSQEELMERGDPNYCDELLE